MPSTLLAVWAFTRDSNHQLFAAQLSLKVCLAQTILTDLWGICTCWRFVKFLESKPTLSFPPKA